jgi:hypothetical protein
LGVGLAFDLCVVNFEEAGFEAAGAVSEAVSGGDALGEEVLAFFECSWVVDTKDDRRLAGWGVFIRIHEKRVRLLWRKGNPGFYTGVP